MMTLEHLVARHGVRGALAATALNAAGMPLELFIGRNVPGLPVWAPLASSAVGLCLLALLVVRLRVATLRLASAVFLVNAAAVLASLSTTGAAYARSGLDLPPFQGDKLAILVIAMLAPEVAVGLVAIFAHVVSMSLRFAAFPPDVRAHFEPGNAWIVVAYAFVGSILLVYRLRSLTLQLSVVQAQADTMAARRVARLLLVARDLSNTPLQTLEFSTSLLRARHPELDGALARVDRAVSRLRDLGALFGGPEARVDWAPGDESFDPESIAAKPAPAERRRPRARRREAA